MKRCLTSALLLTMVSLLATPTVWSKPSDLPADNQIQCPECGEAKSEKPSLPLATAELPPPMIDAMLPAYVEQVLRLACELLPGRAPHDAQAGRLFQLAELYRRTGNLDSARLIYQRVHMLTPTTFLGRLAIDRLTSLEERLRDASEPAETPDSATPRESFRRIREGSIPLGLVEQYY